MIHEPPCRYCGLSFSDIGPGLTNHESYCGAAWYCDCETSDFDAVDQCRQCLRPDARAPRVATAIARVAERLGVVDMSINNWT